MTATASLPTAVLDAPKMGMPVTIITGFLGSGKTTLLNHILSNQQGLKTAVLVNEFGEIGIDNELIVKTDENMVELSNGCICCTINSDLVDAVYRVLESNQKVDYLVVETTGLADPLPVALTFLGTELREMTRLDSIVTVVDSENYSLDLFNSQVAYNQILYGDIILLNKSDRVSAERLDVLEQNILEIKEGSRILRTVRGEVPLGLLLSVGLFESDKYFLPKGDGGGADHAGHDHSGHDHDHAGHDHSGHDHGDCDHDHGVCVHEGDHAHHDHDHSHDHDHGHNDDGPSAIEGFTSVSFVSDRPFAIRKLQNFLDNLLPVSVFRAKGILWFQESGQRHIFHLCGKRFTMDPSEWPGVRKNQLVLIGQGLDHGLLRQQLLDCLAGEEG